MNGLHISDRPEARDCVECGQRVSARKVPGVGYITSPFCTACVEAEDQRERAKQANAAKSLAQKTRRERLMRQGVSWHELEEAKAKNVTLMPELSALAKRVLEEDFSKGWGAYLSGVAGGGKTSQLSLLAEWLDARGERVILTSEDRMLCEIRQNNHDPAQFERAPWLLLDEAGGAKGSEYETGKLELVIDWRVKHRLPTIFASNASIEEIAGQGVWNGRLYSRLFKILATPANIHDGFVTDHRIAAFMSILTEGGQ